MLRGQNQILSCCLSLCYLLLSHWRKFNRIWCVSYSHEWGVQLQKCLTPPPGALGRGQKVNYNFNYKVNFKDFLYQTLRFFHKCKIQNISDRIFTLLPGLPRGGTLGAGVPRRLKIYFFQTWSCGLSNRRG